MGFPRGTTPTITFELEDGDLNLDLTQAKNVYVTFKSGSKTFTKTGDALTVTAKTIAVTLSQQETLSFSDSKIRIQVNWTYDDGVRWSTECVSYGVSEQLLDRVVD